MNPYDEGTPESLIYETEGEPDEEPLQFPANPANTGPDLARVNAIAQTCMARKENMAKFADDALAALAALTEIKARLIVYPALDFTGFDDFVAQLKAALPPSWAFPGRYPAND
jgi:hypothetical protein